MELNGCTSANTDCSYVIAWISQATQKNCFNWSNAWDQGIGFLDHQPSNAYTQDT